MENRQNAMGFWSDKNGTSQSFFHGNFNASISHMCQCGVNRTCVDPGLLCNCDAKLPEWHSYEGIITDKNLLPITAFSYGPIEYELEQAKISIGNLKCSGAFETNCNGDSETELAPPEIIRDDCNYATLESSKRLRIDLESGNSLNCEVKVTLPKSMTVQVTIDDYESESCCSPDYFRIYKVDGRNETLLRTLDGDHGDYEYEFIADAAKFWWKTDSSVPSGPMTVYVNFSA